MRYPWLMGGVKRGSEVEAELRRASRTSASRRLRYMFMDPRLDDRQVPLPLLRPASSMEPRGYLARPSWSSCTVPVIWRPMWQDNLGHAFRDTGSQLLSALEATPWREHIKLVLLTGDGLGMFPHLELILGSLSTMSAESFADFSTRLPHWASWSSPPCRASKRGPPPKPPSYEGTEQRCFRQLFFCGNGTLGTPSTQYRLGQHMVQWMRKEQLLPQPAAPPCTGACKLRLRGGIVTLRLAFHKRSSSGRQLLNTAELIEQCKGWTYVPRGGRTTYKLECSEVEFVDLPSGAAAALEADVFVGMHGANLHNSMFLQPGSSVVEVIPFEYDSSPWGHALAKFNMDDPTSQLLWWSIVACDGALSAPGIVEAEGVFDKLQDKSTNNYARNRSVRLRWAALEAVLRRIVDARGKAEAYRRGYFETGDWRVFMWEGDIQSPTHPGNLTCPYYLGRQAPAPASVGHGAATPTGGL